MDKEILLVWEIVRKDLDGFPVKENSSIRVYASEVSITRNEAYQSMRAGISVKIAFEIRQEDWDLCRHKDSQGNMAYASKILCEDGCYDIVRTYKKGKSTIEVICG